MKRVTSIIILMLIATALPLAAPKKPDFSGRWELDAAKSELRPTKWNSLALVIEHQEPKLRINISLKYPQGPNYTYQIPLTTDGSAASVDMGKNARVYRATWVGANLLLKWNEGGERKENWALSRDGRTLTIVGSAKLVDGKSEAWKYVMIKK
jgi:hypothetical protein